MCFLQNCLQVSEDIQFRISDSRNNRKRPALRFGAVNGF